MNRADERYLACALTDSASAHLKPDDRARLWAKIVAGEQQSAISDLLIFYATTNTEMSVELALQTRRWIDGYAGSDSELMLRQAYERISVARPVTTSGTAGSGETDRRTHRLVARRTARAVSRSTDSTVQCLTG